MYTLSVRLELGFATRGGPLSSKASDMIGEVDSDFEVAWLPSHITVLRPAATRSDFSVWFRISLVAVWVDQKLQQRLKINLQYRLASRTVQTRVCKLLRIRQFAQGPDAEGRQKRLSGDEGEGRATAGLAGAGGDQVTLG